MIDETDEKHRKDPKDQKDPKGQVLQYDTLLAVAE